MFGTGVTVAAALGAAVGAGVVVGSVVGAGVAVGSVVGAGVTDGSVVGAVVGSAVGLADGSGVTTRTGRDGCVFIARIAANGALLVLCSGFYAPSADVAFRFVIDPNEGVCRFVYMYAAGHVVARVPVGVLVELPHSCIRYGIRMLLGGKRIERAG